MAAYGYSTTIASGDFAAQDTAHKRDDPHTIEADAREQGEADYLAECWEKGVCPSCGGDGRFFNMFGTGDQAGGAADTCDDCNGSGKDTRGCPECGDDHDIQACPAIHAELMKEGE